MLNIKIAIIHSPFLHYHLIFQYGNLTLWFSHLTNLIIFIFNIILVYKINLILFKDDRIFFITSLLIAVNPINTEVVAWISARIISLCAISCLASFYYFIFACQCIIRREEFIILFL